MVTAHDFAVCGRHLPYLRVVQRNSYKYMAASLPKYTKALTLRKSSVERKPTYHDVVLESRSLPPLKPEELLVKIDAAAFNHKDVRSLKFLSLPRRELIYNQRYGYGWASIPELSWGAFWEGMAQVSRWIYHIQLLHVNVELTTSVQVLLSPLETQATHC